MSDYYRQFLSSMAGADTHPPTSPDDMNPPLIPGVSMPMSPLPIQGPYPNLGYFTGFHDPVILNPSKSQKNRRKSGAGYNGGIDQVKHRRTRSGCFMCRSRRVKCDESRPICERCRKGNRDCVYPEPPTSKGASGPTSKSKESFQTSPNSSNEAEDDDVETESRLEMIPDEEEPEELLRRTSTSQTSRSLSVSSCAISQSSGRKNSETPSQEGNRSSSPSVSTVTTSSWTPTPNHSELVLSPGGRLDWARLPPDFQQYLGYFVENITNYHYSLANDGDDFFHTILPNVAAHFKPLLNALAGFSAYHVTLHNPNGKLQDFLQYYNRSVTQLLSILKRNDTHNVPVLMTILQLATIEEYLGDWVNLMGHQKAAFEIITHIFNPETVMQTPIGRMCLSWYARFDSMVALMGGFSTDLPREWFAAVADFHRNQSAANPDVLRCKIEDRAAQLRLMSHDMSLLYARRNGDQLSPADYTLEHGRITKQLEAWRTSWDPSLSDPRYLITDFLWWPATDTDDVINSYVPGILFDFPLFNTTVITAEWHSVMMMHKVQSPNVSIKDITVELNSHALSVCQHFQAVQHWPFSPPGALITLQPCISIAAFFLPHNPSHNMWLRRKLSVLETLGHIHPINRRVKLAEIFQDSSCARWWLPNDDGFTSMLQSIRSFADERNAKAVTTQQENLRNMKHLFAKLELNGQKL